MHLTKDVLFNYSVSEIGRFQRPPLVARARQINTDTFPNAGDLTRSLTALKEWIFRAPAKLKVVHVIRETEVLIM